MKPPPSFGRARILGLVGFVLAAVGVADAAYLTQLHFEFDLTEAYFSSACHAVSATGCDVAVKSALSGVGGVPVALLATVFYGVVAVLALGVGFGAKGGRQRRADHWSALTWLANGATAVMIAGSLVLGAFCPFCIGLYAVGLLSALCAHLASRALGGAGLRAGFGDLLRPFTSRLWVPGLACLLACASAAGGYFTVMRRAEAMRDAALEAEIAAMVGPRLDTLETALAPLHLPVREPEVLGRPVDIVEFSDFECPFCRRGWDAIEDVASRRAIRVRFAHFPLSASCNPAMRSEMHPRACAAGAAAVCAQAQGRFFEMGALLFGRQDALERADLEARARALGLDTPAFSACLDAPATLAKLSADAETGARLGVDSTPTLFVDGRKLEGAMGPKALERVLDTLGRK